MTHKYPLLKRLFCLILSILFLAMNSGCSSQALSAADVSKAQTAGYRAVCDDGTAYIAVGTGGRIDRIKSDKTVTKLTSATKVCLNDVVAASGTAVAVGDGGVILFSKDGGKFKPAKSGVKKSLYGVTAFQEAFWAAGAGGALLCSPDGEHWKSVSSGIKNNILSISANDKMCMAVTREGQILISADGKKWSITDYNKLYEGYSELFWFQGVRACGGAFVIVGEHQEHPVAPAILSSDTGEVWREYAFTKINDKPGEEAYPLTVNAVTVDWDQLVAGCDGGKLLTVTECSECNKLDTLCSHNIKDLVSANGQLALVGDGFWFELRKSDAFRQYGIQAEQALKDAGNGACIVDVRTNEEYGLKHIKGSMHIPVDDIETELEKRVPDKSSEIIFYCAKGGRAQKALEKALMMGYVKVYNLGGISDWPYDTETGMSSGGQ